MHCKRDSYYSKAFKGRKSWTLQTVTHSTELLYSLYLESLTEILKCQFTKLIWYITLLSMIIYLCNFCREAYLIITSQIIYIQAVILGNQGMTGSAISFSVSDRILVLSFSISFGIEFDVSISCISILVSDKMLDASFSSPL